MRRAHGWFFGRWVHSHRRPLCSAREFALAPEPAKHADPVALGPRPGGTAYVVLERVA
jgi:hypothetical protein